MIMSLVLLFALSIAQPISSKLNEKQPDIIYILTDDLGHRDVGFTGGQIKTKLTQTGKGR